MLESGWCPSWAVGCGAGCPHLSLRDPESPTQCTFQEMAGPLCRRMPGNPATPSSSEDGALPPGQETPSWLPEGGLGAGVAKYHRCLKDNKA